ncbi:hypothetical protein GCM10022293_50890 [Azospirillum formosense]
MTREAVATDTPARAATWASDGASDARSVREERLRSAGGGIGTSVCARGLGAGGGVKTGCVEMHAPLLFRQG